MMGCPMDNLSMEEMVAQVVRYANPRRQRALHADKLVMASEALSVRHILNDGELAGVAGMSAARRSGKPRNTPCGLLRPRFIDDMAVRALFPQDFTYRQQQG
jgi:hypothetical protein